MYHDFTIFLIKTTFYIGLTYARYVTKEGNHFRLLQDMNAHITLCLNSL